MQPDLSIILPIFNEEAVLPQTLATIVQQMGSIGLSFELICVDDGSSDNSVALLQKEAGRTPQLQIIELSRNFGKEAALAAGLDHVRGRAAILLDSDLQHPPSLIPTMIQAWQNGADVVSGVKKDRGQEGMAYRLLARAFNKMMAGASGQAFHGASDFKVLDRQVVEALKACPERHRFFRGLVAWVGFRTVDIPFDVQERAAGETKWSTTALIRYSLRNLVSFSALPLRAIAFAGAALLLFSGAMGLWTIFRYLRGDSLAGFPTVILQQLIFGG
ncbi:MAG: glycosyltransferase family 2 protein, partial [Polyangiaceae bacterium]|nr:glycosyltransferase family 2 protein [Polyangiaceae bacterium]